MAVVALALWLTLALLVSSRWYIAQLRYLELRRRFGHTDLLEDDGIDRSPSLLALRTVELVKASFKRQDEPHLEAARRLAQRRWLTCGLVAVLGPFVLFVAFIHWGG